MLGVLTREYGISPKDALTTYTEDQIQLLLSQLPLNRIVTFNDKQTKLEREAQYMDCFCDRIKVDNLISIEDNHKLVEARANLRYQIKQEKNIETKNLLQHRLDSLMEKLEK